MARRGKKRKVAALMEELISESQSSPTAAGCTQITGCSMSASGESSGAAADSQSMEPRHATSSLPHECNFDMSFTDKVAITQAMNLVPASFKNYRSVYISNIVEQMTGKKITTDVMENAIESLERSHGVKKLMELGTPPMPVLWETTFKTLQPHMEFLGPPVLRCLMCDKMLESHNSPTVAVCHTFDGPIAAMKITLRCKTCSLNYRYEQYGSKEIGYCYYEEPRCYIRSSKTVYVSRKVYQLFAAAGHHAWCSFEGSAEIYNEMVRKTSKNSALLRRFFTASCTNQADINSDDDDSGLPYELHRKSVGEAFWNAECEDELREGNNLSHKFGSQSSREDVMTEIDKRRASSTYSHSNCSEECRKRGCGTLWSLDGNWKLSYPICMYDAPKDISGFSGQLKYVSACSNQPENGQAFCHEHMEIVASKGVPTTLKEYIKYRKVTDDKSDSRQASADKSDTRQASAASNSQGTTDIINTFPDVSAQLDDEDSQSKPSCNKETGEKKRLQRWTRGHLFIVRGGGHIDTWQPLYQSEGPAQVFLIVLVWMISALQHLARTDRQKLYLAYDNMCHLDNLKVAKKCLPLPGDLKYLWMDINKIIDSLHLKNHKDSKCHELYNPSKLKDTYDSYNTMSCEQTFAWLSRFKKILTAMPKVHHHFYLHRMVKRRNEYISYCYKMGKRPVHPKVKNTDRDADKEHA